MTARPQDKIETHFEQTGSLTRPGPVGRLVRLALGALFLWALYAMLTGGLGLMSSRRVPRSVSLWILVVIAFQLTPYVVNIGFTRNWRRRPQMFVAIAAAVLMAVDFVLYGSWWAPPLGVFVWAWLVYFSTHLGLSFVLSALLGTPGCEMRAIPHLWSLVSRRETKEHYCPGALDRIDRWESARTT